MPRNINIYIIVSALLLGLILFIPIFISANMNFQDNLQLTKTVYQTEQVDIEKLMIDQKLICTLEDGYICVQIPKDMLEKSINIQIKTLKKGFKNPEYSLLTLYKVRNNVFKYFVGNEVISAEVYLLKDELGLKIKEISRSGSIYVNIERQKNYFFNKGIIIVKGYDNDDNLCCLESMNLHSTREGENKLYINTMMSPGCQYIDVYIKYPFSLLTKIEDRVYDKYAKQLYIIVIVDKAYFLKLSQYKNIDNIIDIPLFLKLKGFNQENELVALSSRNMIIRKAGLLLKYYKDTSFIVDTCIANLNISDQVQTSKWDVEILEPTANFLDWAYDKNTQQLYVSALVRKIDFPFLYLLIEGFDKDKNKIYISSRNMRIGDNVIDTCIIPKIPSYLNAINVKSVPYQENKSYIVDNCINVNSHEIYTVGVNNTEKDDTLWLVFKGYNKKGECVWIGSRNFRVRYGTIDTCIVTNHPQDVEKVSTKIVNKNNGVRLVDSFFNKNTSKLYTVISNSSEQKKIVISIIGYNNSKKPVYKVNYKTYIKSNLIATYTINISNKNVVRTSVKVDVVN